MKIVRKSNFDHRDQQVVAESIKSESYAQTMCSALKEDGYCFKVELDDYVLPLGSPYLVELRYFKASGKYYSAGSYFTTKQHMFEIFEEVHERAHGGDLPDLVPGVKEFAVLIDVPLHPHNYPHLVYPPGTP